MLATKIEYIDGLRLRRALIAGAQSVIQRQQYLDDINVFPVPDSDTGTNMASTLASIAERLRRASEASVHTISEVIAESALMGARGNSGAILAQFFQGFSEGLKGYKKASAEIFADAATKAAEWAAEAIATPREGTILTVIRDWAKSLHTHSPDKTDFVDLLKTALVRAKESLAYTPEQMKVLKDAGVVDAGAQGFVYMLEGVLQYIEGGTLTETDWQAAPETEVEVAAAHVHETIENITYRYCTECLVSGINLDRKAIREQLGTFGDSIVVAGSDSKVRLHIHTDSPRAVFDAMGELGTVSHEKADDMRQQYRAAHGDHTHTIGLVVDTGCDLPDELLERYHIHRVPFRIQIGEKQYIDRVTLTNEALYQMLPTLTVHPKTSQPTPGDFKRTYELAGKHYEHLISIHVPATVSGTFQSAKRAAEMVGDHIHVIDGRNLSVALGLIVQRAGELIEQGISLTDLLADIEWSIANTQVFISVDTMDYLVRGGRVSRMKGLLARLLNLKPILSFDDTGKVIALDKTIGGQRAQQKMMALLRERGAKKRNLRFGVVHADAHERAMWYAQQIQTYFETDQVFVSELSPAVGIHGGPGAIGIAMLGEDPPE